MNEAALRQIKARPSPSALGSHMQVWVQVENTSSLGLER